MNLENEAYHWQRLEQAAQNPVWVGTDELLRQCCEHWVTLDMVALDTEFIRVETFYPIPGLIQLADDTQCYLIDPLSITDFSPFAALLENDEVLKVIHAGSEDLELFLHSLGVLPKPIFDTQIAAAFAGWGFSMGLQRMVKHALDVDLGKGETTSDWLQRPLSLEQTLYAALDVAYLPTITRMLRDQLLMKDRLHWVMEECEELEAHVIDSDPEGLEYYRRFSQVWNISDTKRAGLRDLTAWREQTARTRDVPRNRLLRNQYLLEIIERWPTTVEELAKVPEIRRRVVREDGETIVGLIKSAPQSAPENPPKPIVRPLHYVWNKRIKALRDIGRRVAEREDIAIEVLLRKRDIEALIHSIDEAEEYSLPRSLCGWRKALVGDALLTRLNQFEKE